MVNFNLDLAELRIARDACIRESRFLREIQEATGMDTSKLQVSVSLVIAKLSDALTVSMKAVKEKNK